MGRKAKPPYPNKWHVFPIGEHKPIVFSKLSEEDKRAYVEALRLFIPWMIEAVDRAEREIEEWKKENSEDDESEDPKDD
jgi:hypothetical protein